MPPSVTEKPCAYCEKPILWKRSIAAHWESVLYCSNACQRHANRDKRRADAPETEDVLFENNTYGPRKKRKARRVV